MTVTSIDWSKVDHPEETFTRFSSRRSVVYSTKGLVASSQPLATQAGLEILSKGGNAGTIVFQPLLLPLLTTNTPFQQPMPRSLFLPH
jgi:hypothetical protein